MSECSESAERGWAAPRQPEPGVQSAAGLMEARAERFRLTLSELETSRVRCVERLRAAERKLATSARRRSADAGRRAVRQIELDRQRLARELHTGVGQMLAAIRIQVQIVEASVGEPPAPAQEALERISTIAEEALEQVRSVGRRLHPPAWQRLTLDAALRQLCQRAGLEARFETALDIQPLEIDPGAEIKSLFYRTAQEALSNIMRHAQASRIELIFQRVGDRLVLQVRDNGRGFDAAALNGPVNGASAPAGIGLDAIREQARALGGKLLIRSSRIGTTLEVSVKAPQAAA